MQNIRQFSVALLALLLGICLTAACLGLVYSQMQASGQIRWQERSAAIAKQLEADLALQEETLHSIQAAFIAQNELSRFQFNQLVLNSNFSIRSPAVIAMGFIRPIESKNLAEYIAKNRADARFAAAYYVDFSVLSNSQRLQQMQVLDLLGPLNKTNAQWLGDDLSRTLRLKARLEQARDRGQAWSAPMMIHGEKQAGAHAFYMPVYQTILERPTVEALQNSYLGSAVIWLKLDELMANFEHTAQASGLTLRLLDQSESNLSPLYTSEKWAAASENVLLAPQLINVLGQQWRLDFAALSHPISAAESQTLLFLALMGVLLSMLLAILMHYVCRYVTKLQSNDVHALQEMTQRWAQERQNHVILDAISDPLILRDTSGKIVYANAVAEHRFGQDNQCLIGQTEALLDQQELNALAMPVQLAISHQDRDGIARQYEVILKPLRDEHLEWTGTVLQARDISVGAASMADLIAKLERFSEMMEISSDWFWEQDAQARFTYVSGGFFADLEVNPKVFIGKCRWDFGAGGLTETQWAAHRAVLATQQPYRDFEYQSYLNNQMLYFSVSGRPVFDAEGQFVGYRGVGRNVTAMRKAQMALIEAQQRAQATLESIADGVLTTDINGRIDYINPVASALLGWELEMIRGQHLGSVYQSVDAKTRLPLANLVTTALRGNEDNQGARRSVLLNKLGLNFQIEESAARIRDENNRTLGAVLVFRDISNWRDEGERVSI